MANKIEGYCINCKAPREIKDAESITMGNNNNIKAKKGKCAKCGTTMFRIS